MVINDRVREVRKHPNVNMSMEQFGERLNVSKTAISNVETGRNNVSDRLVADICREFHVSELWLRTGEGEMFEERSASEEIAAFAGELINYGTDSFRSRFVYALSKLGPEEWAVLEKIAKEMQKAGQ